MRVWLFTAGMPANTDFARFNFQVPTMGSASAAEPTDPVPIARSAASNTLESMSLMEIPPAARDRNAGRNEAVDYTQVLGPQTNGNPCGRMAALPLRVQTPPPNTYSMPAPPSGTLIDAIVRVVSAALAGSFLTLGGIGLRIGTLRQPLVDPMTPPQKAHHELIG